MRYDLMTLQGPGSQGANAFAAVGFIRDFLPSLVGVHSYPGHSTATATQTTTFTVDGWGGRHLELKDVFYQDPELGIVGRLPCVVGGQAASRPFLATYAAQETVYSMELLWPEPT